MSSSNVYTGFWIDWSGGRLYGSTITVTAANGAFVVAFSALFVQFASGHLWNLLNFIWHQYRAASELRDGLYRQQQVILRNSSTPPATLWNSIKIYWAWRSRAENALLQTLPLAIVAFLYMVGAIAAGISSSCMVSTSGIEVLAQSTSCGQWKGLGAVSDAAKPLLFAAGDIHDKSLISASINYARSCYTNARSSPACNVYATRQLTWASDYNATCPFAPGTCIGSDTSALQLDTGQLDSHAMLGLNAAPKDRITYRRVTTCTPLKTDGRITWQMAGQGSHSSKPDPDDLAKPEMARISQVALYQYGNRVDPDSNWTYIGFPLMANLSYDYRFE